MLQNEILNLLKINTSVILPELGAIMIKPATAGLIFNEFLKFNDGMLIEHISKTKSIDKNEASKDVKKFINHIIKSLAKDQKCDLMPLGVLYIDENEKIILKSTLTFDAETTTGEIIENKSLINETPKTEEPYNSSKISLLSKDDNANNPKTLKENNAMFENEPNSKTQNHESSSDESYYPAERKPLRKILIISFIIAAIAAGLYFVYLKNPSIFSGDESFASDTSSMTKVTSEPKSVTSDFDSNNSEIISDVKTTKNKYHIIAGAFVVEKNASAFMQELQKKGFEPKIVLKRNDYNFISIFSYPTFREANNKYKTFDGSGMPIWIMRY